MFYMSLTHAHLIALSSNETESDNVVDWTNHNALPFFN